MSARQLPVFITILLAILLAMVPLPDAAEAYRPDWVVLTMIYWAMMLPRTWSVGSAWLVGLLLDVAQGTILGQHALALCLVVFITVRFHLLMRVFPLSQLTATVFALLAVYQFMLFWINGVAGIAAAPVSYWAPVLTGAVTWPVAFAFLSGVRLRMQIGR